MPINDDCIVYVSFLCSLPRFRVVLSHRVFIRYPWDNRKVICSFVSFLIDSSDKPVIIACRLARHFRKMMNYGVESSIIIRCNCFEMNLYTVEFIFKPDLHFSIWIEACLTPDVNASVPWSPVYVFMIKHHMNFLFGAYPEEPILRCVF